MCASSNTSRTGRGRPGHPRAAGTPLHVLHERRLVETWLREPEAQAEAARDAFDLGRVAASLDELPQPRHGALRIVALVDARKLADDRRDRGEAGTAAATCP